MPSDSDRLFAQIAQEKGHASPEQLQEGLALLDKIAETGVRVSLAHVLVDRKILSPQAAAAVRTLQAAQERLFVTRRWIAGLRHAPQQDREICDLALSHQLIEARKFDDCVVTQFCIKGFGVRKSLSEILIEKGYLDGQVAEALLELYNSQAASKAAPDRPRSILSLEDLTFCRLTIGRQWITAEQAQQAILTQRKLSKEAKLQQPLAEVLSGMGLLDRDKRLKIEQEMCAGKDAPQTQTGAPGTNVEAKSESRLGELLVESGLVGLPVLEKCLAVQQQMKRMGIVRKLGEILISKGHLRPEQVMAALRAQTAARQAAPETPVRESVLQKITRLRPLRVGAAAVLAAGVVLAGFFVIGPGRDPSSKQPPTVPPGQRSPERTASALPGDSSRDPELVIEQAKAEAEQAAKEFRFAEAITNYQALVDRLAPDAEELRSVTRSSLQLRLHLLEAERHAMDLMIEEINRRKEPPIDLTFSNGARRILLGADASGLTMEALDLARKTQVLWEKIPPADLARLLVLTKCDIKEPLGVAALSAERGAAELIQEIARPPSLEDRAMLERQYGIAWPKPARAETETSQASLKADAPASPVPQPAVTAKAATGPSLLPSDRWSLDEVLLFEPKLQPSQALARAGDFAAAAKEVETVLGHVPEGRYRSFLEERTGNLVVLGELKKTLQANIRAQGAAARVSVRDLPGLDHEAGTIEDANDRNLWVSVEEVRIGIPWEKIGAPAMQALAQRFQVDPAQAALAPLWAAERGELDVAEEMLGKAGSAANRETISAYLDSLKRLRAIAEIPSLRERFQRVLLDQKHPEALEVAQALLARAEALESEEIEKLQSEMARLDDKLAETAIQEAENLLEQGKSQEAAALLAKAMEQHKGSSREEAMRQLRGRADTYQALPVARLESDEEFSNWNGYGFQGTPNRDPDFVRSGSGSLRLAAPEKQYAELSSQFIPHDWSPYESLVLWVYSESKSYARLTFYGSTTRQDAVVFEETLNWTGWKRVSSRIENMHRIGNPKLGDIAEIIIAHFAGQPACTVYLDDIYLLRAGAREPVSQPAQDSPGSEEVQVTVGEPPDSAEPREETVPVIASSGRGLTERKTGLRTALGTRHYVNREHALALVPPANWRAIPPPKEISERYKTEESPVKILVTYGSPNPDEADKLATMKVLYLRGSGSVEEACGAYLEWADTAYVGGLAVIEQEPFPVGPWEGRRVLADLRKGVRQASYIISSGADSAVLEFAGGTDFVSRRTRRFEEVARSFLFLAPEAVASLSSGAGRGAAELPSGWHLYETPHYAIQFNCDREFAKLVGKNLEAILREYVRRFPMEETLGAMEAEGGGIPKFTVKLFKTYGEFQAYASSNGVDGAAAYFSPAQEELVCYKYKTSSQGLQKTIRILYHEASHQYIHLYMGRDVKIPIWLNEGVADYFYGGEFEGSEGFTIKVNRDRVLTIKQAIRSGKHIPLKSFFNYSQSAYYADPELCYAEGWAVAYFLWRTQDPRYAGRLNRFYETLRSSGDSDKAMEAAFGDLAFDALDEDWRKFTLGL